MQKKLQQRKKQILTIPRNQRIAVNLIISHDIICKPNSTPMELPNGLLNVKTLCDSFLHPQGFWFAYII